MKNGLEAAIEQVARRYGFYPADASLRSDNRRKIELICGAGRDRKYLHISRSTRHGVGLFRIAITRKMHDASDKDLLAINGVRPLGNRRTKRQTLRTSNFYGFNRGSRDRACDRYGYLVPADDGLLAFDKVMKVLRRV